MLAAGDAEGISRRSQRGPAHKAALLAHHSLVFTPSESTSCFPKQQQVISPTAANYHECLTGGKKLQVFILLHIKLLFL